MIATVSVNTQQRKGAIGRFLLKVTRIKLISIHLDSFEGAFLPKPRKASLKLPIFRCSRGCASPRIESKSRGTNSKHPGINKCE